MNISNGTTWNDEHGITHNLKRRTFWNGQTAIVSTRCGIFKVLSNVELVSGRDLREEKDTDCMACVAGPDEWP